jgi:hypothetical protein
MVLHRKSLRVLREMEKQGMSEKETLEKLYDAGYTNALMQLHTHIKVFIPKPNSQTQKVLDLISVMLDVNQENKA